MLMLISFYELINVWLTTSNECLFAPLNSVHVPHPKNLVNVIPVEKHLSILSAKRGKIIEQYVCISMTDFRLQNSDNI